ncbi:MAG: cation transporter [Cyanosarcina radialis HA8281-LM2]|jgi:copper chaperone|nr:cation transporter [Cyanosarcina radialis HA8281-LM2]
MALELKISNIKCSDCIETIEEAIAIVDPNAQVQINEELKTVRVEPKDPQQAIASEESIKQAITAAGYQIIPTS